MLRSLGFILWVRSELTYCPQATEVVYLALTYCVFFKIELVVSIWKLRNFTCKPGFLGSPEELGVLTTFSQIWQTLLSPLCRSSPPICFNQLLLRPPAWSLWPLEIASFASDDGEPLKNCYQGSSIIRLNPKEHSGKNMEVRFWGIGKGCHKEKKLNSRALLLHFLAILVVLSRHSLWLPLSPTLDHSSTLFTSFLEMNIFSIAKISGMLLT